MQRARFYAGWRTPLNADERNEFQQTLRDLAPEVHFARGKRAVDDALACERAGDPGGRDREARRATSLLPGLPESRIRPLLEQIQPWTKDDAAAGVRRPTSTLAQSIDRREFYETALEQYGDGQWQELVSACLQVEALLSPGEAASQQMHTRMGVMVFDVLGNARSQRVSARRTREQTGRSAPATDRRAALARSACPVEGRRPLEGAGRRAATAG